MDFELEFSKTIIRDMSLDITSVVKFAFLFIVSLALKHLQHQQTGCFPVFITHSRIAPLF